MALPSSSLARAWRTFVRRPAFFAIAVSSMAIALGLATTVLAQIDALMHPYTPIREANRAFEINFWGFGAGNSRPPNGDVLAALRASQLFSNLTASSELYRQIEVRSGVFSAGVRLAGRDYIDLIGVQPRLGRAFAGGETMEAGVAMVGDDVWKRYFGNAPAIEGAQFTFEQRSYRIVGVVPAEWSQHGVNIWIPPAATPGPRTLRETYTARLRADVTQKNAETVLRAIADRWTSVYGHGRTPMRFTLWSLMPNPLRLRTYHIAMIAAALFILVIASANVSALMLARSVVTRRDQALRLALGARPLDLFRDVASEVTVLALAGAAAGVLIAFVSMGVITALTPPELMWLGFAKPNWSPRVFVGLFGAALACITVSTLLPAWYVTRIAPAEPLKDSSGNTITRTGKRFKLLVVGELALAMILLFGASLINKTARNVAAFDFGYEARHVHAVAPNVAVVPRLTPLSDSARRAGRTRATPTPEILAPELDAVIARIRAVAGVRDAAWVAKDAAERAIVVSQSTLVLDSMLYNPGVYNIGPGFLRTLGIPLVDGRDFVEGDRTATGAAILDRRSAARLFPEGRAVGRMVKLGYAQSKEPWIPVVGVVGNAIHVLPDFPEMEPPPVVYVSRQKQRGFFPGFVYRAERSVGDIAPSVTRTVRDALPPATFVEYGKWVEEYDELLAGRRFTAAIFTALSLASLLLAAAGLFAVLSYSVNQRRREFALRIALGAQRHSILALVAHDGAVMTLAGTGIGAFIAMYAAFGVYNQLWGVYPVDVVSLLIAEAVLLGVTAAASAIPALRAVRADPAEVMRAI